MDNFQIRTDLALEARESVNEEESKLRGVSVEEHYEEEADLRITKVTIDTKNAEKMLGKPMGVYVTMEAPASTAFSISSLAALAGRSTTSPAAIRSATCRGRH